MPRGRAGHAAWSGGPRTDLAFRSNAPIDGLDLRDGDHAKLGILPRKSRTALSPFSCRLCRSRTRGYGNEFIAKAVEIETVAQRAKRRFAPAGAGTASVAAEKE